MDFYQITNNPSKISRIKVVLHSEMSLNQYSNLFVKQSTDSCGCSSAKIMQWRKPSSLQVGKGFGRDYLVSDSACARSLALCSVYVV